MVSMMLCDLDQIINSFGNNIVRQLARLLRRPGCLVLKDVFEAIQDDHRREALGE